MLVNELAKELGITVSVAEVKKLGVQKFMSISEASKILLTSKVVKCIGDMKRDIQELKENNNEKRSGSK